MRKELKKGDLEYEMFNDYWQICKQYNIPEDTDEYWQDLIKAGNDFYKKYNCKYAREIINAFVNSREDMYRNLKMP